MALLMGAEAADKPAHDDMDEDNLLRALMEAQGQG
jgi:DNA-directed RNA polymerase subunit omega